MITLVNYNQNPENQKKFFQARTTIDNWEPLPPFSQLDEINFSNSKISEFLDTLVPVRSLQPHSQSISNSMNGSDKQQVMVSSSWAFLFTSTVANFVDILEIHQNASVLSQTRSKRGRKRTTAPSSKSPIQNQNSKKPAKMSSNSQSGNRREYYQNIQKNILKYYTMFTKYTLLWILKNNMEKKMD